MKKAGGTPILLFLFGLLCILLVWIVVAGVKANKEASVRMAATDLDLKQRKAIVHDVSGLIDECKSIGETNFDIHGKVLVWDAQSQEFIPMKGAIAPDLEASSNDNPITVLMLVKRTGEGNTMGRYTDATGRSSGTIAMGEILEFAIAYWPEKKAVGLGDVNSEPPVLISESEAHSGVVFNNDAEAIARFINSHHRHLN
jgi:hypothetical protein